MIGEALPEAQGKSCHAIKYSNRIAWNAQIHAQTRTRTFTVYVLFLHTQTGQPMSKTGLVTWKSPTANHSSSNFLSQAV